MEQKWHVPFASAILAAIEDGAINIFRDGDGFLVAPWGSLVGAVAPALGPLSTSGLLVNSGQLLFFRILLKNEAILRSLSS